MKYTGKKPYGKIFCILLMVIFTIVMIADVVNYCVTPARNRGGFDPGGDFAFSVPEGYEPSGGDMQLPDIQGNGEMPAFAEMPDGNMRSGQGGLLQAARSAWIPILIVCVLADALCAALLLRILRKEKIQGDTLPDAADAPETGEEEDADEPPRRKRGSWIAIVCLAVAFGVILSMFPTGDDAQLSSVTVHQEVISGTPEAAQISTILSGAGTLEADSLTAVTVPQQVTVLKYHVRNGETVTAGEPLVSVDKTSAAAAMKELDEVMDDLDDDLETERQKSNSSSITATAAGRVKKIYAQKNDAVTDVLYANGALMLLSLDGTMKVSFESDLDLHVGDAVTVRYSGVSEDGRIASVREGKITVTLSDESAEYGAQAKILNESGETIGEGTLAIGSELKVIGYYGTVDAVNVAVGDKVSIGTTLMTLTDTGYTTDYRMLIARRSELEEQIQTLSRLAQTGFVYAEKDGIVSGVPDDAEIELLSGTSSVGADSLSDTGGDWQLVLLSDVTPLEEPEDTTPPETDPPEVDPTEPPLNGVYAASLVSAGRGTLYVWISPNAITDDLDTLDLSAMKGQMTRFGEYPYSGIGDIPLIDGGESKTVALSDLMQNDLLLLSFTDGAVTGVIRAQRLTGADQGGQGQLPGGGMPSEIGGMAMPSGGTGGKSQQKSYDLYSTEQTELLYVSDQQEVSLSISVDELDILSLSTGLDAQVTLDAMKGQAFTGTVARIGHEGTTGDGNTKYSVTVTLPREASMLDGMNASVKIVTATSDAAVAVPAAALVEDDGKTYVYTAYDAKSDTLSGLVEVETGASDGELVEILSGLDIGDTFYYRYADTVTYSFLTRA